jgi:hypothetical protein
MRAQQDKIKILFFISFVLSVTTLAQVFIPFSFWNGSTATLTISDANTYNYGSINVSTNTDKTFTVSNSGLMAASAMAGASFSNAAYTFKGGSYPGTGGTCTTSLASAASCTVVVTANSAATGTIASTLQITYVGKTPATASRAITATFVNTATQLAWITTPSFVKINDCNAVTVQRQDSAGNPITTASATAITSLLFNNGVTGTYYSDSGCTATITTSSIAAATNSITVYFKNTTSGQTGILVATAAGLTSASQNVTITAAPTKLYVNPAPTIKTNTCTSFVIYTMDANNYQSNAGSTITVNLTTSGANIYYSDSGCTASITSTTILSGTSSRTLYTQNATIQTATLTGTDNAAVLSPSSKAVNFNSSLTWWNSSWTQRVRIDINNTDQAAAFTNQPVLVKLTSSIVNYSDIQANGADIRFVASDDTTALNYEFDKWSSGGTSEIWVRIPSIAASSSAGFFYLYYKNPSAVDAQNKTGVWTNYWSVWHLGEDPAGTAPQFKDSTSGARNGTSTNSPARANGQVGDAVDLNGASDAVDINSDLSVALGASSTFSCWMRSSQVGNNTMWQAPGITGIEQAGGGNDIFFGWIDASGFIGVTAGNGANAKSSFVVNNNAWRHVTITRNSTSGAVVFYVNGVQSGAATSEAGAKTTYFDLLGEIGDTGGTPVNYNGMLDEVRIFNSVQTAAQVLADFKFMSNTHVIYNSIETGP